MSRARTSSAVMATGNAPEPMGHSAHGFQVAAFGRVSNGGGVQVFDQIAANRMVATFERAKSAAGTHWRGIPIHVGYPALDRKTYPDQAKYGSVIALEVRADGLYARARWSTVGRALIDSEAYDFPNPVWDTEPLPNERGAVRPVALVSIGLTNAPGTGAKPFGANSADLTAANTAPSTFALPQPTDNTSQPMLEPAADRFHRLVYQRMSAENESRDKAWAYCAETHKQTYADYQAETTASETATSAANEAETARKTKAANERRVRMENVNDAVAERIKNHPGLDYGVAFDLVKQEQPHLFAGMQEPAPIVAANAAKYSNPETRRQAITAAMAEKRKRYPDSGVAYDILRQERPELFADGQ